MTATPASTGSIGDGSENGAGGDVATEAASAAERYPSEEFTAAEVDVLDRHFTNVDRPVFALVDLPEVVKGALFARYSRTHKSLRRLFLDEFAGVDAGELDAVGSGGVGNERAEALYRRVFVEFGDDSVAQLGGVHLACEQASNVLTKVLEWGRLMAYLEQSTRYIAYDQPAAGGGYRYHIPAEIAGGGLERHYRVGLDAMFDGYALAVQRLRSHFDSEPPPGGDPAAWRASTRARAFDAARGMLPAAATSNLGIYGTGQSYEALLVRMRAHPLREVRDYAAMMLVELRKVVGAFVARVDVADRGVETSRYQASTRTAAEQIAAMLIDNTVADTGDGAEVTLVDYDPDGETKMVAAMLYPHTTISETQLLAQVRQMTADERVGVIRGYCGDRRNRRHRPGRALERSFYRFDVLSDYGAFRDLQRHRMLTIEWQPLSTAHGYVTPDAVADAGADGLYTDTMARSAKLHERLAGTGCEQYPVALAYRIRYSMNMNAREAMHVCELRTTPQGHPAYRRVCQQMHTLIAGTAGHRAVAEAMRFVDHSDGRGGRLESENRSAGRRRQLTG